jgi:hypothetical protein
MILNPRWNPKNKFCVLTLHYSADPEKNTPEWIAKEKAGTSERGWKREYEIDYDTFEGKAVFPEFTQHHIKTFEYEPMPIKFVYRGWDFGYHHPAVTIAWINEFDQLLVRKEILGNDEGIKDFGTRVIHICRNEFPNAKWIDACDPAGHQKNDKSEFTSVEVLGSLGVYPTSKPSNIQEKLEILRQRLKIRNDGKYGLLIHPECTRLINGFKGGYRYAEDIEGKVSDEVPIKDNYYDNIFDSLEYMMTNTFELAPDKRETGLQEQSTKNDIMSSRMSDVNEYF